MSLIDTHAHLNNASLINDVPQIIARAKTEGGVEKIIVVGTNLEDSITAVELVAAYPEIYATVGVYPGHAKETIDFDSLKNLATQSKVVALGEIGLDFYHPGFDKAAQIKLFETQLDLAQQLNLPVVIHQRQAKEEVLSILNENKGRLRGVFHCFTEDLAYANKVFELGFLISFTGIVTYKNTKDLEEVVKNIPETTFMLETDSPYLTPVPFRQERNEPKNVKIIAEKIAKIRNVDASVIAAATTRNAQNLFSLA